MALYVVLISYFAFVMFLGLRKDVDLAIQAWPGHPESRVVANNARLCNMLAVVGMVVLWFLTAFRGISIGADTHVYCYYFGVFATMGTRPAVHLEMLFQYLNILISRFTSDPHIFLLITATMCYAGLMIYFGKYAKNLPLTVTLFFASFFSVYVNVLRQAMAMTLVLYGYQMLKEKKWIPTAIIFFMATLLHNSAVVCFLLFFNFKWLRNKWVLWSGGLIMAAVVFSGNFVKLALLMIQRFPSFFVSYFFQTYLESQYASTGWLAVSYSLIKYLIWYFLMSASMRQGNREDELAINTMTLLLLFNVLAYSLNLFDRVTMYFSLIAIVELPNMLHSNRIRNPRLWLLLCCAMALLFFAFQLVFRPYWNNLYPYELWF